MLCVHFFVGKLILQASGDLKQFAAGCLTSTLGVFQPVWNKNIPIYEAADPSWTHLRQFC